MSFHHWFTIAGKILSNLIVTHKPINILLGFDENEFHSQKEKKIHVMLIVDNVFIVICGFSLSWSNNGFALVLHVCLCLSF